jgi:predicted enzyme related to lactoylglutathione lyase
MNNGLKIKMYSFTLDCTEPQELAKFYATLLHWEVMVIDEDWACVYAPNTYQGTYPGIMFQLNLEYKPPIWPQEPEAQQQMAHLDFAVNDLESAVQFAIQCGATIAKDQYSKDWSVMFDPAGHPFCLCQMKEIMDSEHFGLL